MKALIPIRDTGGKPGVHARDLHEFLESKQRFADWIKARIEKYGFVEGEDYVSFHKSMKREVGASVRTEYVLSMDMAKELAMVEATSQGQKARRYFIEAEKQLREITHGVQREEIRDKSRRTRNYFTNILSQHGYDKKHHYIQTTKQMKRELGIESKKSDMDLIELSLVTAAESLATANIMATGARGYYQVNPLCVGSSLAITESRIRELEQ